MNDATVQTLVQAISGEHVTIFFLVLARITPMFLLAPVFSSPQLIPRVRAVVAMALAIGLTPIAAIGQHPPTNTLAVIGLILEGFIVGLGFAFAVATVFAAVQSAGILGDALTGFSFGSSIDPLNGNSGGALTNLYSVVGLAIFLVIGGDEWMVRGLAATFRAVPITEGPKIAPLVSDSVALAGTVFVGAVEVAAPIMLALVVTDIAFGMVAKVVPQLNVFAVGFPVKIGVGLLVVTATLPFIAGWMTGQLDASVGAAIHSLQVA